MYNKFVKEVINLDEIESPAIDGSLIYNRARLAESFDNSRITISMACYNRLEKTRSCIESILKYTKEDTYEFLFFDNASDDGTSDFLQSIPYPHKTIIRFTKNHRANFIYRFILDHSKSRYVVCLANDMIVTQNWLQKLVTCMESDIQIGFIAPVVTNTNLRFRFDISTLKEDDMNLLSKKYQNSVPELWEERTRIATPIFMLRREVLDIVGSMDYGYFHEFAEDDLEMRVRAAGYKVVLAGDTYLHHNHYLQERDLNINQEATENGSANYQNKYQGIHPWDDMDNYIFPYLQHLSPPIPVGKPNVLGIDTRCGQPLLDIKNFYYENGTNDISIHSYTTNAKYYTPLTYISKNVKFGEIDKLYAEYTDQAFDVILWTEPLNNYSNSLELVTHLLKILKKGGLMLLSLNNTYDIKTLLTIIRDDTSFRSLNKNFHIFYQDVLDCLERNDVSDVNINSDFYYFNNELKRVSQAICASLSFISEDSDSILRRLQISKYWFTIKK